MNPLHRLPYLRAVISFTASTALAAQTCYHQGSLPTPATIEAGPVALGCLGAPQWPTWHLLTPTHRAPAPHMGFNPGNATAKARVLIAYRCTGFLLVPVVPFQVTTMGYVIDRPEIECSPATS